VTGSSGVVANMAAYILLTRFLGIPLEVASPIAIETSILSNFFLNNVWTFRNRETENSYFTKLLRFHTIAALGGITNYSILLLLINVLGWWDIAANFTGIIVGTLVNYSMNSFWTWKELARKSPHAAQRFSSRIKSEPSSFSGKRAESQPQIEQLRNGNI
jgi:dolichol-phosphate mannosyltransferase